MHAAALIFQETDAPADLPACGTDPGFLCRWIYEQTEDEELAELVEFLLGRPLRILLIIIAAWIISRLLRASVAELLEQLANRIAAPADEREGLSEELSDEQRQKALELRRNRSDFIQRQRRSQQRTLTLSSVLQNIISTVVWALALILILSELSISLGPLLAGAGVAGIAIGFGAQSVVRDFLAGFFIIIEDQYGVGDIVDLGEANGTVEDVSLRATRVRDVNGALWVVPNGEIRRVANKSQLWARCVLDIEVAYSANIDEASAIMKRVATELWNEHEASDRTILDEPEVWGVQALGSFGVSIRLTLKTEPAEQYNVARELRGRIKRAFEDAGVAIPDRRTLWHEGG